jgi:hypothetical protein
MFGRTASRVIVNHDQDLRIEKEDRKYINYLDGILKEHSVAKARFLWKMALSVC